jgi:hypothetical protein
MLLTVGQPFCCCLGFSWMQNAKIMTIPLCSSYCFLDCAVVASTSFFKAYNDPFLSAAFFLLLLRALQNLSLLLFVVVSSSNLLVEVCFPKK